MSCQSTQTTDTLACSYTCDINTLQAKYPHIDFRDVFTTIFDGLRNLEDDCTQDNQGNKECWETIK